MRTEGHAAWVESQVCPERGRAAFEEMSGRDRIASVDRDDDYVYTYILGAEFAGAYIERFGRDAWWWLLEQAEPDAATVHAVADARIVRRWRDPTVLADVLRGLPGLSGGRTDTDPYSPSDLIRQIFSSGEDVQPPELHLKAAMRARVGAGATAASAFALLVGSEAEAAALVAARRENIGSGHAGIATSSARSFELGGAVRTRPIPERATPDGVTETLWVTLPTRWGGSYQELWVARGPISWLLAWNGRRQDRQLFAALGRLVGLDLDTTPVGVARDPVATAALDVLAPPQPLPRATRSAIWAAIQLDPSAPAACAAAAVSALGEVASSGRAASMWNAGRVEEAPVLLRGLCVGRPAEDTPAWCAEVPQLR